MRVSSTNVILFEPSINNIECVLVPYSFPETKIELRFSYIIGHRFCNSSSGRYL